MNRTLRTLSVLAVTATAMAGLVACTPPVTNLAGCEAPFGPGDNSNAVVATGRVGSEPRVSFPTPLVATDGQVTVVERGDGPVVYPGNAVELFITTFAAESGEALSSTGYDAPRISIVGNDLFAQFAECATEGSRLAVVASGAAVYGSAEASESVGVDPAAVLVAVLDVESTFQGKANGWDRPPQAGMPAVVLAPSGQPGIIVPNEDPPTDLRIAVLKAGTGATVEEGDDVVLQYTGLVWGNQSPFDTTWTGTQQAPATPTTLTAQDFTQSADQQGVVPGFAQAIIGQQVGSQVLVVIPPEFGYPAGQAPSSIPDGSTMIFVIDILKIED